MSSGNQAINTSGSSGLSTVIVVSIVIVALLVLALILYWIFGRRRRTRSEFMGDEVAFQKLRARSVPSTRTAAPPARERMIAGIPKSDWDFYFKQMQEHYKAQLRSGQWLQERFGSDETEEKAAARREEEYLLKTFYQHWLNDIRAKHPNNWRGAWQHIKDSVEVWKPIQLAKGKWGLDYVKYS